MPAERYFIDCSFRVHDLLELTGSEYHHLSHVMRTRKGEKIELVNGKGALGTALVQELGKNKGVLKVESLFQEEEHPCRLILAQSFPKPNRLDFILEKGTELGVDAFWLFPGDNSQKREFYPHQIERAHQLTIAAMKQCGRLSLPTIEIHPSLNEWPPIQGSAYFGDVEPKAPLFEEAWKKESAHPLPLLFITGPESGFSPEEVNHLRELGVKGVKLHANILRTDTASLTALSLLSHWSYQHTES